MENIKQQENINSAKKSVCFTLWDWILLVFAMIMLPGGITIAIEEGLVLILSGKLDDFSQLVAGLFGVAISIYLLKSKLKKFKEIKTAKAYKIIVIIARMIAALILIPAILSTLTIYNNAKRPADGSSPSLEMDENIVDDEQITGTLYRNNQYKFRIKFPKGWEIMDGDGSNVVKKAVKDGSTVGIIAKNFKDMPEFEELKQEFIEETGTILTDDIVDEALSGLNANDFSDQDFENMMSEILEGILSNHREPKLLEKRIGNIGGEKAFYVKSETLVKVLHIGEADMISITYTTLHNGIFYHIFSGFPKEEAQSIERQIFLSMASFVFENF